jgi:plasmid replication initiation protein
MNKLNGDLTIIPPKDEVLKPSGLIRTNHSLTLMEHKIFNVLLKMVVERQDDKTQKIETTFDEIRSLYGGDIENKQIRATMRSLQRSIIEIEGVKENGKEWDISGQYLGSVAFEKGDSLVKYDFSNMLLEALMTKYQYARLNLMTISQLKSRYTVLLYELLQDYKGIGSKNFSIDDIKKYFGLTEKDTDFDTRFFKKRVLDKAVKEINEKTAFFIDYEVKKRGVQITEIKLVWRTDEKTLSPNQHRQNFRQWLQNRYFERRIDTKNGVSVVVRKNQSRQFLLFHNTTNKPIPRTEAWEIYDELYNERKYLFNEGIKQGFFVSLFTTYEEDLEAFLDIENLVGVEVGATTRQHTPKKYSPNFTWWYLDIDGNPWEFEEELDNEILEINNYSFLRKEEVIPF